MDLPTMAVVMPVIASVIGTLLAIMLGQVISKLNSIERHLEKLNGKFYEHAMEPNIHAAGLARADEKLKNLVDITLKLHSRLDHVEEIAHGKG